MFLPRPPVCCPGLREQDHADPTKLQSAKITLCVFVDKKNKRLAVGNYGK